MTMLVNWKLKYQENQVNQWSQANKQLLHPSSNSKLKIMLAKKLNKVLRNTMLGVMSCFVVWDKRAHISCLVSVRAFWRSYTNTTSHDLMKLDILEEVHWQQGQNSFKLHSRKLCLLGLSASWSRAIFLIEKTGSPRLQSRSMHSSRMDRLGDSVLLQ